MNRHFRFSVAGLKFHTFLLSLGVLSCVLFGAPLLAEGDHASSCAEASFLPLGTTLEASHEPLLDRDVFRLDVASAGIVTLEISADSGRDPRLRLLGRDCVGGERARFLERSDRRQAFWVDQPGSYYVEVAGHGGHAGSVYTLHTGFAPEPAAADLSWRAPVDLLDACSALGDPLAAPAVKSVNTDEKDPVIPVPPPRIVAVGKGAETFGEAVVVSLRGEAPQVGLKSIDTDEKDPVIPVPPPRSPIRPGSRAVLLAEAIDEHDTDLVVLRASGAGHLVIDAEGAAILGSLFAGSGCVPAAQVASGVPLGREGALIVPAGDYVLRIDPEPGTTGSYWLRVAQLVASAE